MKYNINRALKELGAIDKAHESGKITKAKHDSRSKEVLKKLAYRDSEFKALLKKSVKKK